MADLTWSLVELSEATRVRARTIRHYIQRDLLPAANTRGRNAHYSDTHRDRLLAIRCLRIREGLGLPAIRQLFNNLSAEEIRAIGAGGRVDRVKLAGIGRQPVETEPQRDQPGLADRQHSGGQIEMWATIRITPDIELRARGMGREALAGLQALGSELRRVIQNDSGPQSQPVDGDSGTRIVSSLLAPLNETLL